MVQPLDLWALRSLYTMYIYLGYSYQLRDLLARILPYWNSKMPLYGYDVIRNRTKERILHALQIFRLFIQYDILIVFLYSYLHGLYAFGLNETNMFDDAAKHAKQVLFNNSTHHTRIILNCNFFLSGLNEVV